MIKVLCFKGIKKKTLKDFEGEQWPLADKEHYGENIPDFRKSKYTLIAKDDSLIIGFIYMSIDMGVATIDSLLVHHAFRRKGIASDLLKNAESKALGEGCHVIRLETGEDWDARNFYAKHGYAIQAHLKKYYGRRDFILMDKRL